MHEPYDDQLESLAQSVSTKKEEKRKRTFKNVISWILILSGIVIIAIPIVGRLTANRKQASMLDDFYAALEVSNQDQLQTDYQALDAALLWGSEVEHQDESAGNFSEITGLVEDADLQEAELTTLPDAIGVIEISKIGLKHPIGEGADLETLKYVIGHVPESAPLNELGNAVLAGHRSHSYGTFFNRIDELEKGDQIHITSVNGESRTYEVYEKLFVDPTDLSVMRGSSQYRVITLITCHPPVNSDSRLIIHAVDVEQLKAP